MAGQIQDWEVPHAAAQGMYGAPIDPRMMLQQLFQQVVAGQPLDLSMAQNPVQVPLENPFGFGNQYNGAPVMDPTTQDVRFNGLSSNNFSTAPPEASALLDWLGQLIPRGIDNR